MPRRSDASALPVIYVLGHRQPDTDAIAAAIGYPQPMGRIEPSAVPAGGLGELNAQTRRALEQSGAAQPE